MGEGVGWCIGGLWVGGWGWGQWEMGGGGSAVMERRKGCPVSEMDAHCHSGCRSCLLSLTLSSQ